MSAALLLAIETATADASVALLCGERVLAARAVAPPASEKLLPVVLALLAEAEVSIDALDAFALAVGPGSFTGLRVGVSTLKGLAFASTQLVVPVPTLAALALRASLEASVGDALVAALLDARRGEVYAALHSGDPADPPRVGPSVLTSGALVEAIEAQTAGSACFAIGDGCAVAGAALRDRFGARVACLGPALATPGAEAVGRLAVRLLARGAGIRAEALAPLYLRRAEAEVQRTGVRFEAAPGSHDVL